MTVSLLQMDIVWGSPLENISRAETLIREQTADLYVLPEMWATGYSARPEDIVADEHDSVALRWMQLVAAGRRCALSGSLAIRDARGYCVNRHYFVTPDSVARYDKHHLFTFAHEDVNYVAGDAHVVVTYGGLRFLLLTCYDLRFPLWSRYGYAGVYDAIVYVASWPAARQDAWDALLRARAIENQCYVIGVNRVGRERKTTFTGGSAVVDPSGRVLVSCESRECACRVSLDVEEVTDVRRRFPVLADRDACLQR